MTCFLVYAYMRAYVCVCVKRYPDTYPLVSDGFTFAF
jgi:hypothetical protein